MANIRRCQEGCIRGNSFCFFAYGLQACFKFVQMSRNCGTFDVCGLKAVKYKSQTLVFQKLAPKFYLDSRSIGGCFLGQRF